MKQKRRSNSIQVAMEYLKSHLNDCKNDSVYAKAIIGAYDLNECAEKRR